MSAGRDALRLDRRQFLVAGMSVAGGLVLGLPGVTRAAGGDDRMIGFFIEIGPDEDRVRPRTPKLTPLVTSATP